MKLSITASLCAGAFACSHASPPAQYSEGSRSPAFAQQQAAPVPAPATPTVASTEPAPASTSAATAIAPETAPPADANAPTPTPPAVAPPPDVPLTPASGTGAPRAASGTASAQLVQTGPVPDRAQSNEDQASIREIRGLLAADSSLAAVAPRVIVVARSGRVWLRGQVNTAEQRAAVEKAARRAAGVIDVRNELVVLE